MGTVGAREGAEKRNTYGGSGLALCTNNLILPQTLVSQNTTNIALGNTEESHENDLDVDLAPAVK